VPSIELWEYDLPVARHRDYIPTAWRKLPTSYLINAKWGKKTNSSGAEARLSQAFMPGAKAPPPNTAFMRGLHKRRHLRRRANRNQLAAEVGDEPKEEGERGAEDEAGNDGKVESGAFAAVNDVAGELSQAKGELATEVEKSPNEDQETAEDQKRAA